MKTMKLSDFNNYNYFSKKNGHGDVVRIGSNYVINYTMNGQRLYTGCTLIVPTGVQNV